MPSLFTFRRERAREAWERFEDGHSSECVEDLRLSQEIANAGNYMCAIQLNIGHEGLMRETSHTVF